MTAHAIFCLLLALPTPAADDDTKTFQGKWNFTAMTADGDKASDDALKGMELVVDGDKYKQRVDNAVAEEGTFKLSADKSPKEVEMVITEGQEKGKTQLGIYKFDGETATFCVSEAGVKTRPTDFTAEAGSSRLLVVLKKVKD